MTDTLFSKEAILSYYDSQIRPFFKDFNLTNMHHSDFEKSTDSKEERIELNKHYLVVFPIRDSIIGFNASYFNDLRINNIIHYITEIHVLREFLSSTHNSQFFNTSTWPTFVFRLNKLREYLLPYIDNDNTITELSLQSNIEILPQTHIVHDTPNIPPIDQRIRNSMSHFLNN